MKRLFCLLLALCLSPLPLLAQKAMATSQLFVREHQAGLELAIRIKIAPGWHLYHEQLGPADAVGQPTVVKLSAGELAFSKVWFPAPQEFEQPGLGDDGGDTYILGHTGELTLFARAELAEGVPPPAAQTVRAEITGLTCDEAGCIPYREQLVGQGAGPDELWAAFPASLRPAPAAPSALPALALQAPSTELWGKAPGGPGTASKAPASSALYLRAHGEQVEAALVITLAPGWHIYHSDLGSPDAVGLPTRLSFSGAGLRWAAPCFPEPQAFEQFGLSALAHSGRVVLRARAELEAGAFLDAALAAARVTLTGQICNDRLCEDYRVELASMGSGADADFARSSNPLEGTAAVQALEQPAAGSQPGRESQAAMAGGPAQPDGKAKRSESLLGFLLQCMGGALFALLMPCTYPMIPITISFFTKQANARGKSALGLAILYGVGIVAMFIAIGWIVGPIIVAFAAHPVTNLVIAVVFVLFGLSLLGVFLLQPPAFVMQIAGKASTTGGALGVFLMGATLVVTSFTCTAPIVGAILSLGATAGGTLKLIAGMGVFGLTMALPFVALALVPGKLRNIPRSGEWMNTFKVFLGFVELAAALKFLSNVDLVWGWGVLSRELYLLLWFGILLCAALYLLGFVHLEGHTQAGIGPGRLIGGLVTFLFALYCGYGAAGYELDETMTAIVPPYSHARIAADHGAAGSHSIASTAPMVVIDDYDRARELALSSGKGLLVNFTGHT